jgi:hypothetical protein
MSRSIPGNQEQPFFIFAQEKKKKEKRKKKKIESSSSKERHANRTTDHLSCKAAFT